jgi:hypothetical protein
MRILSANLRLRNPPKPQRLAQGRPHLARCARCSGGERHRLPHRLLESHEEKAAHPESHCHQDQNELNVPTSHWAGL